MTRATFTPTTRRSWLGCAAAGGLLAALLAAGCDVAPPPASFKNLDITGAEYANRIDLPDADGQRRTLADFKGKLPVVFFGYTQCPDVCPTTLAQLQETQRLMGADGDKLVALFITLDPERDTPELLKAYIGQFNPHWVALRGSAEETQAAAKTFKVFFRKVDGKTPTSYTVDHTAASYVLDTQGRIRLYVRHNTPPADLAADLKTLLAQAK